MLTWKLAYTHKYRNL